MVKFGGIGHIPGKQHGLRGRARRIRKEETEDLETLLAASGLSEEERRLLEGRQRRQLRSDHEGRVRRSGLRPNRELQILDVLMLIVLGGGLVALLGLSLIVIFQ